MNLQVHPVTAQDWEVFPWFPQFAPVIGHGIQMQDKFYRIRDVIHPDKVIAELMTKEEADVHA